ncbi:hypothetical protein BT63DRAFT_445126 [Microthyrium microscopicum]|uniref:Transcription initiation factor TFIID subunit 8 n=1 Tax=Microthyrium microscopicum TaxID=703497 RepID=A0A6A6UUA6_9PEZI|nr:hypothetical protein BT63DRAFT_445126 [Microthyrium microscopicum]
MTASPLSSATSSAMKRSSEDLESTLQDDRPTKRIRRFRHSIKHKQPFAIETATRIHDEFLTHSQMTRSITLALSAHGFTAVESSALESFRAVTEEYILRFLKSVNSSMRGARRAEPTPHDFITALSHFNLTSSSFSSFLEMPPYPSICQPSLIIPLEAEKPAPDLDTVLGTSLQSTQPRNKYVPKHMPGLPSAHTWKSTAVMPSREEDARKMRERATREGVLAEQALRRLAQASKAAHKDNAVNGTGTGAKSKPQKSWMAALKAIKKADQEEEEKEEASAEANQVDVDMEDPQAMLPPIGAKKSKTAPNESFETAAVVNCERLHWRELARGKA